MATRRIKFIGKTKYKKDNVCRTNLFWAFPGAIVAVPEDIAVRLLVHADVWVEAEADDKGLPIGKDPLDQLDANITREDRVLIAIGIIEKEDCLLEVMAYFGDDDEVILVGDDGVVDHQANYERLLVLEASLIEPELVYTEAEQALIDQGLDPAGAQGSGNSDTGLGDADTVSTEDDAKKDNAPTMIPFSVNRDEAIVQAINRLDRDSDEHFTKEGVPRVEAISGLLNYEVSAQERTAGWDAVQEGEGN